MKAFYTIFLFLSLVYVSSCHENFDPHTLPRPLIVDLYKKLPISEDVALHCTSWRFAGEANNLSPWKTIPQECKDYVDDYMNGKAYKSDLERVSKEAILYARTVELKGDGKDIWVFDVDETLLSNLPYYARHGYGYFLCFCHSAHTVFSISLRARFQITEFELSFQILKFILIFECDFK